MPLLIIGAVFLIVFIGGWWFYSSSKSGSKTPPANVSNSTGGVPTPDNFANASPGAQPPHMLGSPTATVTLEEFADFQCPTCASVHTIMKQVTTSYGNRIKFIFRHYPLPQHNKAYEAATAAEAAGLQGKFWDMQNALFTNQPNWVASSDHRKLFADYAGQFGLDVEKFQNDILGIAAKSRVDADMQRGRSLRVNSTPSVYVNGALIPYEQMTADGLRRIIDAELQKAAAQSQPKAPASAGEKSEKPATENK